MKKVIYSLGLFSLMLSLAGCTTEQNVASIKGAEPLKESQFYDMLKKEYGDTELQNYLVSETLKTEFKDVVTEEDIDSAFEEIVVQYGGTKELEEVIKRYGYKDLDSYKELISQNLMIEKLVEDSINLSEKEYEQYHKELVSFNVISVDTEKEAKEVLEKLGKKEKFADLVEEYSTDMNTLQGESGLVSIKDTSLYPEEVLKEVKNIKVGEYSKKAIYSEEQETYYIISPVLNMEEEGSVEESKSDIDEYVKLIKSQDNDYIQNQLSELLKKYDVKVLDETLKGALSGFNLEETDSSESGESSSEETENSESEK